MDWFPVVFVAFKLLVLGTGMFFAVKWHYDQGKKGKDQPTEVRAVLKASGKVAVLFLVALVGVGVAAFVVGNMLGLDLSFT